MQVGDADNCKCRVFRPGAGGSWFYVVSIALTLLTSYREADCGVLQADVDPTPIRLPMVDGKEMRFTRLSTEDGLSQTRVSQIIQGDRGFMWLGTQYGLNRYDGQVQGVCARSPAPEQSGWHFHYGLVQGSRRLPLDWMRLISGQV